MFVTGSGGAVSLVFFSLCGVSLAWAGHRTRELRRAAGGCALQSMEVARYQVMSPREFEEAIAYLWRRDGCPDARVVGGAGDLGADIIAIAPDGRRIVIQCKRYGPTMKVGSPDLHRVGGTGFTIHGAHVATVVTTNVFTAPAPGYTTQHRIRRVGEHALAASASRTGPAPWM
ncbi:restriction endonuclease [Streptomyces sp. NPDC057694]|uniref:restriction endonuclease n=1 Tax=Streptomyces sp. NPDC057694 TaxID=3346216 RepID=UPI0036AD94ED